MIYFSPIKFKFFSETFERNKNNESSEVQNSFAQKAGLGCLKCLSNSVIEVRRRTLEAAEI